MVVVSSPEAAETVLAAGEHLLTGAASRRLLPILGRGSLPCLDGEAHTERRRTLLPGFSHLSRHAGWIEDAFARELAQWPHDRPVRALPRLRRVALHVAARIVLGEEPPGLARRLDDYVAGRAAIATWLPRLAPARRLLTERRDALDQLLLEAIRTGADGAAAALVGAGLDTAVVLEELRTLLLVAHESTACALAWTLERLARHPHVLDRLRDGEDEYLEAVVREVLRDRPPVLDAVRLAAAPLDLPRGPCVASGVIAMVAPWLVHHRSDLYPIPHRFEPERFLDGKPRPDGYVPFGGGPRRCLGGQLATIELKALIRTVARATVLAPADPRPERSRLVGTAVAPARGAAVVLARR